MKTVFIINPKAGKRSAVKRLTAEIHACLDGTDTPYEIYTTSASGDATHIARQVTANGEEMRLFACGGDGTAFQVFNGICRKDKVQLGVIPCGTGNDFLKTLGNRDFSSVAAQLQGEAVPMDVIGVGEYRCLNQASMGLDAQVCLHKSKFSRLPFISGKVAYLLALFWCFFSAIRNRLTVQIGDREPVTGDFLFAVGANGRYCGGGFCGAPNALPDDGLLDCLQVKSVSRFRILTLIRHYSKGTHLQFTHVCEVTRAKTMTITAPKPTAVNLDGEVIKTDSVTFEVIPNGVRFILPKAISST